MTAAFAVALTFTPMPDTWRNAVVITAWIITAFAGGAWVNEHRKASVLSPLKKRERLDELVNRGKTLSDKWLRRESPRIRTILWKQEVRKFVQHDFSMTMNDQFRQYSVFSPGTNYKIRLAQIQGQLSQRMGSAALEIDSLLQGLKWIRREQFGREP